MIQGAYRRWRHRWAQRAHATPLDCTAATLALDRCSPSSQAARQSSGTACRTLACPTPPWTTTTPAPRGPEEAALSVVLDMSASNSSHRSDEAEMEVHCSQYRLQQHRERGAEEDSSPTHRPKPATSGRKRTTLDQRRKEAARLAAREDLNRIERLAGALGGMDMPQQLKGEPGCMPRSAPGQPPVCPQGAPRVPPAA
ncbi:hypothetical protein CYMTET_14819 [Cymbomonas tetramitiformis]|uniref:Uncharacterized protein n=1 Tax=Cymbomonas tetramitiformis TaxID=36881 RepID=A0AAE0L9J3_9CHLO|nr:hypothetical protein CYMTET_14819 [Cymbomonas tetramitiformis]